MRWLPLTVITVLVALAAAWGFTALGEFIAVDRCLDAGQVYDYGSGVCRSNIAQAPPASLLRIRPPDGGAILGAVVTAALLAWGLRRYGRGNPASAD